MGKVYIEQRELSANARLARDVASHLYTRQLTGKVLIVAVQPRVFLATLKKEWNKLIIRVRRERASVLYDIRAKSLDYQIAGMEKCIFTLKSPLDYPQANIYVVGAHDLTDVLPYCMTAYVTCRAEVDPDLLQAFINSMPAHALVVLYA